MEATQAQLISLLDGKKQFTIPIYQRTYSWHQKQCHQLFDDIIKIGSDTSELTHFIGSIVYFKPGTSPVTSVPELLVIDGQQRLTTVTLLLLALTHFLKDNKDVKLEDETWEEIQETYIVNKHRKDDSKYKLLLTKKDKDTLKNLIDEVKNDESASQRVLDNYTFFKQQITANNVQKLYHGIKKLQIVDVILERGKDDPQLIFESLNSTGVDLTQADLIRNYILMGQTIEKQNDLYLKYWYPMEKNFGEKIHLLAWFIRDYLTMQDNAIPRIDEVYEKYKKFINNNKAFTSIDDTIKSLNRYGDFYVRMALHKEKDPQLLSKFKEISKLRIDTSYPLLLAIYNDFEDEVITKDEFVSILDLVISYVFRRAICGIPTNSLNKTFATLYKRLKRETYVESFQANLILLDSYRRLPNDIEFEKALKVKDVYNFRTRNYLLESLENYKRKELINAENYTIEHILPQNENVPLAWQQELGENFKEVKAKYLHTLGNLTLTRYNSELSDKSFSIKMDLEGGFKMSPLFLNDSVRNKTIWNETSIESRAKVLAERAIKVWKIPQLSQETLDIYREPETVNEESVYTIDDYEHLKDDMLTLYKALEKRILNLDSSVRVEFKKLYIAFKASTNFVDIVPQKRRLRLSLNADFDEIKDPDNLCKDVSGLGRWGNGDVEVGVDNQTNLDAVMTLIQQALDLQLENG
jgi:uncharacterized protein with ParB-like and HNH nuclease domain/predicted transport protein